MTTSSFLNLTAGEVRFDFQPPPVPAGAPSLAFQVLDASGQPEGPEVTVFTPPLAVDTTDQVEGFNAAALPGGGFVLAWEERLTAVGPSLTVEGLTLSVYDAHGHADALRGVSFVIGHGFAADTTFSNLGLFGLSGDGYAVVYERHDGDQSSLHFGLAPPQGLPSDLILASAPNHVSTADGNLTFGFANGDLLLAGGEVTSTLTGGAGDDTLMAGSNGDFLRGADGNDSIQGGLGFDNVNGNKGDDVIDGGLAGADWLVGGQGDDLITAHSGDGLLFGNLGADTLNGGTGNELLRGGQDNDVLNGGAGNDQLFGDRGDDTLAGGAGADVFHSFSGAGADVVTDFNAAEGDRVQLDPGTIYAVSQSGADVVIDIHVADAVSAEVILKNVQLSSLPADFIFLA